MSAVKYVVAGRMPPASAFTAALEQQMIFSLKVRGGHFAAFAGLDFVLMHPVWFFKAVEHLSRASPLFFARSPSHFVQSLAFGAFRQSVVPFVGHSPAS